MRIRNRDIRCRTAMEAVALYIDSSRSRGNTRRGTVMVFVMAILGILFIAGVAFLQEVTFHAKTIEADKQVRAREAIVDSIEVLVESTLKAGVVSQNGIPYSPASSELIYDITPSLLTDGSDPLGYSASPYQYLEWKSYGLTLSPWAEVPGIHPLIAQIEPYGCNLYHDEAPGAMKFMYDTRPRIASTTDLWGVTNGPKYPAIIAQPRLDWGVIGGESATEMDESQWQRWWHPIDASGTMYSAECAINMDSDADGIVDSLGLRFEPGNTGNAAFRSITASQWENAFAKNKEENQIYSGYAAVGVKVIPHTALCNLIYSHPWTVNYVLGDSPEVTYDSDSYMANAISTPRPVPDIVEPEIRNRNVIPARNTVSDSLLNNVSIDSKNPLISALETDNGYRWWPFDPEDSNDLEPTMCSGPFRTLMNPDNTLTMNPADSAMYDRRHLVTTVSSDDLLLRGVRFPDGHPLAGQDVIEWIENYDLNDNGAIDQTDPFRLDEYIREHGRVQLSFDQLELEMTSMGPLWNSLAPYQNKQAIANAIRDMFWVMLWNQPDMNRNGVYEYKDETNLQETDDDWIRAVQAASLAANVMDYVDFDDDTSTPETDDLNLPTIVLPIDPAIAETAFNDYQVFGFERQPFITEVYAELESQDEGDPNTTCQYILEPSGTQYAVELFNPYETDLNLDGYVLEDLSTISNLNEVCIDSGVDPEQLQVDLSGQTIPPYSFLTIEGLGAANRDSSLSYDGGPFVFTKDSVIVLKRSFIADSTTRTLIVDKVDLTTDNTHTLNYDVDSIGDWEDIGTSIFSIQRDTSLADYRKTSSNVYTWRFVIPVSYLVNDKDHTTLGETNNTPHGMETNAAAIRPVYADVSNAGTFKNALPTTGCLLFAMKYAHVENASLAAEVDRYKPANYFEYSTATNPISLFAESNLIDNGHMPVFDPVEEATPTLDTNNIPYWKTNYHGDVPAWPASNGAPLNWACGQPGGSSQLPWGQFIFDYFTRLPLNTLGISSVYTSRDDYLDSTSPLRTDCLPFVEEDGHRVHGRININAAPWKVLAGIPLRQTSQFYYQPLAIKDRVESMLTQPGGLTGNPIQILGNIPAYGIVAYREARELPNGCTGGEHPEYSCSYSYAGRILPPHASNTSIDPDLHDDQVIALPGIRQGKGFLTVGELFNIHHLASNINSLDRWTEAANIMTDLNGEPLVQTRMDGGVVGRTILATGATYEDYIQAIAWTVACCDWVTTKSNVFTVYGVLSDPGPDLQPDATARKTINDRAVRFQTTFDRTPLLTNPNAAMDRIGERKISMYDDPRSD